MRNCLKVSDVRDDAFHHQEFPKCAQTLSQSVRIPERLSRTSEKQQAQLGSEICETTAGKRNGRRRSRTQTSYALWAAAVTSGDPCARAHSCARPWVHAYVCVGARVRVFVCVHVSLRACVCTCVCAPVASLGK